MRSDIQAKIEELIKLTRMTKSWQDNVSKHLCDFMTCIADLSADDEGITATNFVQAGVMIENASRIYAVNVDIVWEHMNVVLQSMATQNSSNKPSNVAEISTNAEEVVRKRRKRVICENFEEFVPSVINPDVRGEERTQSIKPLPMSHSVMRKADWKRRKRPYQVFDVEKDTLDLSEYSVMYQASVFGKLQRNMLKEVVEDSSNGRCSISELIYTLELLYKELSLTVIDSGSEYSSGSLDDRSLTPSNEIIEPTERETVLVTPPPSPLTVKRSNSATIESLSAVKRSMSDADLEKETIAGGLINKDSREHLVTIAEESRKNGNKKATVVLTPNLKPLKREERKRRPSGCDMVTIHYMDVNMLYIQHTSEESPSKILRRFYIQKNYKKKVVLKEVSRISLSIRLSLDGGDRGLSQDVEFAPVVDEEHRRLSQDITEDFRGFENSGTDSEDEDGFLGFPDESSCAERLADSNDVNACTCGSAGTEHSCTCGSTGSTQNCCTCGGASSSEKSCTCDDAGTTENSCTCGSAGSAEKSCTCDDVRTRENPCTCGSAGTNGNSCTCENAGTSEKACSCGSAERTCSCARNVDSAMPSTSTDNVDCESEHGNAEPCGLDTALESRELEESCQQMLERVIEWERFIRPKLKQAHERGHFDIHGIGSQILESFPDSDSESKLDFCQFMSDKPQVDVARYFLATLQLANSQNVDIQKSVPGDLSMDCMQLKLVSSVRHHQALEDYEAPSEGARRKRRRAHVEQSSDSESDIYCSSGGRVGFKSKRKRNTR